jgi:predicted nucleotidyltransferase
MLRPMQIDPGGTMAGQPALVVRRALRALSMRMEWKTADLEAAAALPSGSGPGLARELRREGLIESRGRGVWTVSQAGCTFAAATAAKRLTRPTAEYALSEFMKRVARVNDDPYFLGKVARVVLFGSMLNPETDRPSDIDLAIEVVPKEPDRNRLQEQNRGRAQVLARTGRSFRNEFEMLFCWRFEVWRFLKGRTRAISLHDYQAEKSLVLAVPHRVLIGGDEPPPLPELRQPAQPATVHRRPRRDDDCPF